MRLAARAPNHLGDGVMALPALHALTQVGELVVYAPRWGPDLYRSLNAEVRPLGPIAAVDRAVLFAPSLRAAWEARRCARRIGTPTDHRSWLLTDPVPQSPRTADLYRALAERAGGVVEGVPHWEADPGDLAAEVPVGHIGLVPISAAGAVRQWPGFGALADRVDAPVVFYGGPGEDVAVARIAGRHLQRVGQPLPALAATLRRCATLVTNDSGLAHFGRAVGVPVVTLFGSTTARWTGAPGAVAVEGPALPCRPCSGRHCRVGDLACLDIEVERVLAAIGVARG